MKEFKRCLLSGLFATSCLLGAGGKVVGQEVRHSQYYTIMPSVNPAATGAFGGDYRFLGNYRSSAYSASDKPFTTMYASYDQAIAKYRSDGQYRQSFFGAGLSFLNDKAGTGDLALTQIDALLSYNLRMGASNYLTLGAKVGYATRSVNYSNYIWGSQYDEEAGTLDPTAYSDPLAENTKASYVPISMGLMWNYANPDKLKLNAGIALNRLNRPSAAFDAKFQEKLPMQIVGNLGAEWFVPNTVLSLMPLMLYQHHAYYSEISFGVLAKMFLSFDSKMTHIKKSSALYAGLFYRTNGDLVIAGKFDLRQNMALGLSYDVAVSGISDAKAVDKRGAFELVLTYYGFFKERTLLPRKSSVEFF